MAGLRRVAPHGRLRALHDATGRSPLRRGGDHRPARPRGLAPAARPLGEQNVGGTDGVLPGVHDRGPGEQPVLGSTLRPAPPARSRAGSIRCPRLPRTGRTTAGHGPKIRPVTSSRNSSSACPKRAAATPATIAVPTITSAYSVTEAPRSRPIQPRRSTSAPIPCHQREATLVQPDATREAFRRSGPGEVGWNLARSLEATRPPSSRY